ncbi:MAG TPA: chemotaxis protein CheB [Flavisolibacter sp.]|nr:chemotaxis protein CheB [Flavisolibacter sp.]
MAESSINNKYRLLIIGGSAGSLEVLIQLLPSIRQDLGVAIVIILHRKNVESYLPDLLSEKASWPVKEAEEKEPILPGMIYLAPPDYHLLIEKDETFSLDYSEKVHYSRPAIDVTFEAAAEVYGFSSIGVLLSGANADGTEGIIKIKEAGGLTIVQDPAEATVSYMPQQAIKSLEVDYILNTKQMIDVINNLNRM